MAQPLFQYVSGTFWRPETKFPVFKKTGCVTRFEFRTAGFLWVTDEDDYPDDETIDGVLVWKNMFRHPKAACDMSVQEDNMMCFDKTGAGPIVQALCPMAYNQPPPPTTTERD